MARHGRARVSPSLGRTRPGGSDRHPGNTSGRPVHPLRIRDGRGHRNRHRLALDAGGRDGGPGHRCRLLREIRVRQRLDQRNRAHRHWNGGRTAGLGGRIAAERGRVSVVRSGDRRRRPRDGLHHGLRGARALRSRPDGRRLRVDGGGERGDAGHGGPAAIGRPGADGRRARLLGPAPAGQRRQPSRVLRLQPGARRADAGPDMAARLAAARVRKSVPGGDDHGCLGLEIGTRPTSTSRQRSTWPSPSSSSWR